MNAGAPLAVGIDARRAAAAERFHARGVPNRRVEDWKYSDLRSVLGEAGLSAVVAQWLVASLPPGVELFDLSQKNPPDWVTAHFGEAAQNEMGAASLALSSGGIALRVPKGAVIAAPLRLDFTAIGHVRALLVLEDGASLTLVEGASASEFRNVGFEIVLGDGAVLHHVRLAPTATGVQVEEVSVRIARGAQYRAHYASFGARLSRLELAIVLEGEGAEAHLSGVSVLGHDSHADVTTRVDHAVGNTQSTQLFKHVAGGKSRAVYQGKVRVAPHANGSDSRQTAKALLIGTRAEADLKPELEILADDVKCAHGAAVGDLDDESIFYLRSRGLPEDEARNLLIRAFLGDATAEIADEAMRAQVWSEIETALSRAAAP